jgi:hypothetical protein
MILEIFAVENLCCVPVLLRSFGVVGCSTWFHHACSCPPPPTHSIINLISCPVLQYGCQDGIKLKAVCAAEMIDATTFAVFLVL